VRGINNGVAGWILDFQHLVSEVNLQLSAFVTFRVGDEYRAGNIGPHASARRRDVRRVRMCSVSHLRVIAAQQGRRQDFGQGEIRNRLVSLQGIGHDLRRFLVPGMVDIDLQVVLGCVTRIGHSSIEEFYLSCDFTQSVYFLRCEQFGNLEEHFACLCLLAVGAGNFNHMTIIRPASGHWCDQVI
jgi:hypothetical protein